MLRLALTKMERNNKKAQVHPQQGYFQLLARMAFPPAIIGINDAIECFRFSIRRSGQLWPHKFSSKKICLFRDFDLNMKSFFMIAAPVQDHCTAGAGENTESTSRITVTTIGVSGRSLSLLGPAGPPPSWLGSLSQVMYPDFPLYSTQFFSEKHVI